MTITTIPKSEGYPGLTRMTVNNRTFVAVGDPKQGKRVLEKFVKGVK